MSQTQGRAAPATAILRGSLLLLGTFAPALMALGVTARAKGRRGGRAPHGGVGGNHQIRATPSVESFWNPVPIPDVFPLG